MLRQGPSNPLSLSPVLSKRKCKYLNLKIKSNRNNYLPPMQAQPELQHLYLPMHFLTQWTPQVIKYSRNVNLLLLLWDHVARTVCCDQEKQAASPKPASTPVRPRVPRGSRSRTPLSPVVESPGPSRDLESKQVTSGGSVDYSSNLSYASGNLSGNMGNRRETFPVI